MLPLYGEKDYQFPLIHTVHSDDEELLNIIDGEWFEILHHFPWADYRHVAAAYYDALYEFNRSASQATVEAPEALPETREQARQRLLFDRPTLQPVPRPADRILYRDGVVEISVAKVDPMSVGPGVVPNRLVGRKPKCFFGLLKSFIGTTLMGFPAEPEQVHLLLQSNPSFVRVCGFGAKRKNDTDRYCAVVVPSLRKLEQFDQVMRQAGLWEQIKVAQVKANLDSGVIEIEQALVGDTTHYHAYSGFETVVYVDEQGNEKKKSQSKPTKLCRCPDWSVCGHDWVLCDEGAGTIVKSSTKIYWGHKASIIGMPGQGVILDAVAIVDAATHDGQTFFPHVVKVFNQYPALANGVNFVLYDSACDDIALKVRFAEDLNVELRASLNPRRSKPITDNLPRGMEKITPHGIPVCNNGYEMVFRGIRYANETFIFEAPHDEQGVSVCMNCKLRSECCNRGSTTGRNLTVSFDTLPQIDAADPPMAKRYKAMMKGRPSVERMIKRIKCDLGDDRLSKRGNQSFQACLDKSMIGYHLLLRHLH